MEYRLELVNKNSRYGVFNSNDELIADYKYKSLAMDHMRALNEGIEFVMRDLSYYKEMG